MTECILVKVPPPLNIGVLQGWLPNISTLSSARPDDDLCQSFQVCLTQQQMYELCDDGIGNKAFAMLAESFAKLLSVNE